MGRKSGISIRSYAAATAASGQRQQADDSAVQMQIEASERATLQATLDTRPINTKRKYASYQTEFQIWCSEKQFCDGATVTKGKLHLFLTEQVVGRESKKKKGTFVGGSTVCGYVNAIVDLYNQQVALKINSNVHPRSAQVKQLLKNVQAQTTETRKKNYQDRGVGSLLDGYHSEEQFRQICDTFFLLGDLRGRAAFLVSHFGLLRGENVRDLELADMFSQVLDGEGFQTCIALVILIQHGKTNTYGKLQHVGYIRNKDVHVCPVGAVAFYLFERFHIDLEPFPFFRTAKDWYDVKFLRGRTRTKSISYNTHKKSYESVFNRLGLTFNKKTHINRQQGVRQLERCDVDSSQTRRHGRWGQDTMEGVYSAPLARGAMRALSGHPARSRLYYLERACVDPPQDLQRKIFPDLETYKKKILDGDWEQNLAARGFIELLEYLRIVVLEDAAFLYELLPTTVQQHEVFGERFQQYRSEALARANSTEHPVEMQLQVAMPLLAQQLSTQHATVMDTISSGHQQLVNLVEHSQQQLTSFLQGEVTFRLQPVPDSSSRLHSQTTVQCGDGVEQPADTQQQQQLTPPLSSSAVPQYSMSRQISTVKELWVEWHEGLVNRPSIEYLESTYGTKWRSSAKETKYFSRRLYVIKYVRKLVEGGMTADVAIAKADCERGRRSIDGFSKLLRSKQVI